MSVNILKTESEIPVKLLLWQLLNCTLGLPKVNPYSILYHNAKNLCTIIWVHIFEEA